jgi:thiamine-phosphate pyrophosphorylase
MNEKRFFDVVEESINGGVSIIQLREKTASTRDFYKIAIKLKELCDKYDVPLIINDRLDIAIAVDTAGVHVGDEDLPPSVVREIIGNNKILGVSASSVKKGKDAEKDGADYLGVGAVFPTSSKEKEVIDIDELKKIVETVNIPVVAIGGINEENVDQLKNSGIDGVAVISSIMQSVNPKKTSQNLKDRLGIK